MKRSRSCRLVCATLLLTLLIAVLVPSVGHPAAASTLSRKTCKTVIKKVHGKKKKVRVCTTRKPTPTLRPTATPTPTPTPLLMATPTPTPDALAPRGFMFTISWSDYRQDPDPADDHSDFTGNAATDAGSTVTLSGHVCGEDLNAKPWQWTDTVESFDRSDGYDSKTTVTVSAPFTEGMTWGTGTLTLVSGPPPQMRIDDHGAAGLTVGQPVITAPLEEDLSCPAPAP